MSKMTYATALQAALKDADAAPARTGRRREEIEAALASITAALRGPLPNIERIWLCVDRRELQNELRALEVQP